MRPLYSSEMPGGRLLGDCVPLSLDPGDRTEPGITEVVGVAVPELVRDPESEAVDANRVERDGFDRRYGRSPSDEAGDALCLGRVIEDSASA
jgi:hypothetical protein